jgi:hypothetical protein
MPDQTIALSADAIAPMVHWIRHEKVMLDSDLATLYGIEARVLNQAGKRNLERFPADFMFQVTPEEAEEVRRSRSQSVTLNPTSGKPRTSCVARSMPPISRPTCSRSSSSSASLTCMMSCWPIRPTPSSSGTAKPSPPTLGAAIEPERWERRFSLADIETELDANEITMAIKDAEKVKRAFSMTAVIPCARSKTFPSPVMDG